MKTCTKCNGAGLIGSGPNPHLQEGAKRVCDECGGSGKIKDGQIDASPATEESTLSTPAEAASPKHRGILDSIFRRG